MRKKITVIALLAYTTQNAQITQNYLKIAVREAPTKEVLCVKIAEHRCYIKLVETIFKGVTDISEAENPAANAREQIDAINTVVEFIREKHVKPSCKKLSDDTLFTDFNTASEDETTINKHSGKQNTSGRIHQQMEGTARHHSEKQEQGEKRK